MARVCKSVVLGDSIMGLNHSIVVLSDGAMVLSDLSDEHSISISISIGFVSRGSEPQYRDLERQYQGIERLFQTNIA